MIENLILAHLVKDDEYLRKVFPFLKVEYFQAESQKTIFEFCTDFVNKYKTAPTFDAILLGLENASVSQATYQETKKLVEQLVQTDRLDASRKQWIIDETEKFCQNRALYIALSSSIGLVDKGASAAGAVPDMLRDALSITFDTHIGHDYFEESERRYDLIHQNVKRIPFDIDLLNTITNGGLAPKTLNIVAGSTGIGKSMVMCHIATSTIAQGKNVLYITMEMAEERIAQRIDANLLDVSMEALDDMAKPIYDQAFKRLKQQNSFGKLIIKEYPTGMANINHFRSLLHELAIKRNFVPDLLIVDYINICSSARLKNTGQVNTYSYVKAVAEELRGLAVEFNLPCLSATQFNRGGFDNNDPSLTNTSDSIGLPATVDLQLALIATEELQNEGLILIKQLKNRYSDESKHKRFTVCVDKSKMRLFNDPKQTFVATVASQVQQQSQVTAFTPGKSKFSSAGSSGITY